LLGIRFLQMMETSRLRYRRWLDQRLRVTPFPATLNRA
jgi:CTP-dependent riboflavin kinase